MLVLASVVGGAALLSSADDTVAVWQVVHDLPAGSPVGSDDVRVAHVRFGEASVAASYLPATGAFATGARSTTDLHAGELLTASALGRSATQQTLELPLGVAPSHEPADLHAGDHVDVWAVPERSGVDRGAGSTPLRVLHDVVVLSAGGDLSGLSGQRQIVVGIDAGADVAAVLAKTADAQVVLVRLAG